MLYRSDYDLQDFMTMIYIVAMVTICVTSLWWIPIIALKFNQAECSVWVSKKMVYNGKCHFVKVEPVGEYGNSKKVSIYSDVQKWHQVKKFISDDVEVRERMEKP